MPAERRRQGRCETTIQTHRICQAGRMKENAPLTVQYRNRQCILVVSERVKLLDNISKLKTPVYTFTGPSD